MLSQIDQTVNTSSGPRRIPRERRRVIFLRPGETAARSCSRFTTRTVVRLIREGEALVVICRNSRRRFVFVCGIPTRIRVAVISRRTRIVVHCVR